MKIFVFGPPVMFICICVESILSLVTYLAKEHRNEAQIVEG